MRHPGRAWQWPFLQRFLLLAIFVCGIGEICAVSQPGSDGAVVDVVDFHDTLQPIRSRIFAQQVRDANTDGAIALLIDLSTPGGFTKATDEMADAIRNSRVPVIVWVGHRDTRVSAAGLRLLAEADTILMSSGSYLTPQWTETPRLLAAESRAAGSRALEQGLTAAVLSHRRNPAIIHELAYGSHWFTAEEAQSAGFIDGIADRQHEVLQVAAEVGMHRKSGNTPAPRFAGARLQGLEISSRDNLLVPLMNPDLSLLLLVLGGLLIYLEINTPGMVIPGAAGLFLCLISLYALSLLGLDPPAVLLALLSVVLLLAEARAPRRGLFAIPGVFLLTGCLVFLVKGPIPQLEIDVASAMGAGIGFGGLTATLIVAGNAARKSKVLTGADAMLGWLAVAQTPLSPEGKVLVRGELWDARVAEGDSLIPAGDHVRVVRADGRVLEVTAVPLPQSFGMSA